MKDRRSTLQRCKKKAPTTTKDSYEFQKKKEKKAFCERGCVCVCVWL